MELRLVLGQEFSTRAPFRRAVLAEKAYHRLMCDAVLRERGSPEDLLVGNTKAWLDTWHDMGLLALDSTRSEREAFEELSAVQCAAAMRGLPPRNHLLEKARARGLGYPAELQAESPQARTLLLNLQAVNLPRLDVAFSRHLQQLARRRGVRIVLAILAYRSTTGSYPADLASVERLMGTRLEPDPFTGKAFVFERGPSGFHLSATVLPSPPVPGTPSEVLRLWPPGAAKN